MRGFFPTKHIDTQDKLEEEAAYIQANEERIFDSKSGFAVGDKVNHKVFRDGEIVEVREDISCYLINFDKMETVRNINIRISLTKAE